jgi:hypothetical protein
MKNYEPFDMKGKKGTYPKPDPTYGLKRGGTNNVTKGPGSQRKGQKFRAKYDPNSDKVFHAYGRGKKAKRVYLSDKTAKKYGYLPEPM